MGRNQEMPTYTQALYEARELAMERMQTEATELQSAGIVGVQHRPAQPRVGLARDRVLRDRHGVVPVSIEHEIEKPALVLPLTG